MEKIIARYRARGLKLTAPRLSILRFLEGNTSHPSAEEIYREIKKKHPTVSFATVYNTLGMLKDIGDVVELNIDLERRHYDPNTTSHHHVICMRCHKIEDIFEDYSHIKIPKDIQKKIKIIGMNVNFYGICDKCRGKDINKKRG